jgi:hypothetical protein
MRLISNEGRVTSWRALLKSKYTPSVMSVHISTHTHTHKMEIAFIKLHEIKHRWVEQTSASHVYNTHQSLHLKSQFCRTDIPPQRSVNNMAVELYNI